MKTTICVFCLSLLLAAPALADGSGIPDLSHSYATIGYSGDVSIFCLPNGEGQSLSACSAADGSLVDATITVTLLDNWDTPIYLYPFEDIWLEPSSGFMGFCNGGSMADSDTDPHGRTTFSYPLLAGGAGIGLMVVISGDPLNQEPFPITANSPDLTRDGIVNLSDLAIFAGQFISGAYDYTCDFFFDGKLGVQDVVLFAEARGAACP